MTRTILILVLFVVSALPGLAAEEDAVCLECHSNAEALAKALGDSSRSVGSLLIDKERYERSVHAGRGCAECHFDYEETPHTDEAESVTCAECHEEAQEAYGKSIHGQATGTAVASCRDCHGVHDVLRATERDARLNPLNVHRVCGKCHFSIDPETATLAELEQEPYTHDSHAHGILRQGLSVSATCVSCHGGHQIRSMGDPESRVARGNVENVCGQCHIGIVEQYRESVHFLRSNGAERTGATCSDCHKHHEIQASTGEFRGSVAETCTECHSERGGSFRKNYHGKRTTLGNDDQIATCASCHGAHRIVPGDDPGSPVHGDNLVATCAKCHPGAHEEFTKFLVHADITDGENFPTLNLIYRVMTGLLIGVLILGGLHVLLWLFRASAAGDWRRRKVPAGMRYVRRWPRVYVFYHITLMTCVLMLASTGLPLHYADRPWAIKLMNVFGGVIAAGYVHRVFAVSMVVLFAAFLVHLAVRLLVVREKGVFSRLNTMLPTFKDFQDLVGNLRWFLFLGPRPKYGRWTYWEKFDFWAVFWGMFVIGLSGLMLWYPEWATRYVPGWFINAAVIVHGIEALLDIAFIFTVHIFHANLRPDKFPMDTMYFTGRMTEEEMRHERPMEYEQALADGTLETMMARTPATRARVLAYIIGTIAILLGVGFVVAMIAAVAMG